MASAAMSHPQTAPAVPEYPIVDATEGESPGRENDTEKDSQIVKSLILMSHRLV